MNIFIRTLSGNYYSTEEYKIQVSYKQKEGNKDTCGIKDEGFLIRAAFIYKKKSTIYFLEGEDGVIILNGSAIESIETCKSDPTESITYLPGYLV